MKQNKETRHPAGLAVESNVATGLLDSDASNRIKW